jgi:cyclophilin family peptidyl-prolyl cis-trans isomerase
MWWWIGGAVAVVLLALVAYWFTLGPGKAAPPEPTAIPPEPTQAPSPTVAAEQEEEEGATSTTPPIESTEEEETSMPPPADRANMYSQPPNMQIDAAKSYVATIATDKGDVVVDLDAGTAPQTVNNFVFLAREGYYDGLTFHRVEPDFVIQGGDPLGTGSGGPGYTVPAEIELEHVKGAIAMARRGDEVNPERASSGSQFYITLEATPFLDGAYTAFGQVADGMDVVESIEIGDAILSITIQEE